MKRILLVALLLVAFVGAQPANAMDGENLALRDGVVRGAVKADHREFLGIPFAAPPTGSNRFGPPQPVTPWAGTRPATSSKPWCPQAAPFLGPVVPSSEDCLYVDVYTPPAARSKNLPVMVWIYGGAYLLGASSQYKLTSLVTRGDVIGVAINYRVGPFGFLDGNWGLLDQQAALRWVRSNAAAFGGDPGNVTIFGESAGGNSVCQQLASPLARGLFDKAIVQSGACGSSTLDGQSAAAAEATGREYMRSVGCSDLACLRSKSQNDLLKSPLAQFNSMKVAFRPVVDGTVVTGSTGDVFAAGRQAPVPVLIGGNQDEGRLFVAIFQHLAKLRRTTPADYRAALTDLFGSRVAAIEAEYGTGDEALANVYTDGLFACPGLRATRALARTAPAVWSYEFREQHTPTSGLDPLMPLGAHHAAELVYLGLPAVDVSLNPADQRLSTEMITDWTTFARTGHLDWPQASTGDLRTYASAGEAIAKVGDGHRCDLWN